VRKAREVIWGLNGPLAVNMLTVANHCCHPFVTHTFAEWPGRGYFEALTWPYSVELRGFEPLTPCMPCRCATSCATAPIVGRRSVYRPSSGVVAGLLLGRRAGVVLLEPPAAAAVGE
jgi:hypothetical protein